MRLHFMQHHLVLPFFGSRDDRLEARFDQAIVRVHRVEGFRCVADDDENSELADATGRRNQSLFTPTCVHFELFVRAR